MGGYCHPLYFIVFFFFQTPDDDATNDGSPVRTCDHSYLLAIIKIA